MHSDISLIPEACNMRAKIADLYCAPFRIHKDIKM